MNPRTSGNSGTAGLTAVLFHVCQTCARQIQIPFCPAPAEMVYPVCIHKPSADEGGLGVALKQQKNLYHNLASCIPGLSATSLFYYLQASRHCRKVLNHNECSQVSFHIAPCLLSSSCGVLFLVIYLMHQCQVCDLWFQCFEKLEPAAWGRFKIDRNKTSFSKHPANVLPHIAAAVNTDVATVREPGKSYLSLTTNHLKSVDSAVVGSILQELHQSSTIGQTDN